MVRSLTDNTEIPQVEVEFVEDAVTVFILKGLEIAFDPDAQMWTVSTPPEYEDAEMILISFEDSKTIEDQEFCGIPVTRADWDRMIKLVS